jgi:hypothetical protein
MIRFAIKRNHEKTPSVGSNTKNNTSNEIKEVMNMTTAEKIAAANVLLDTKPKRVKKDKGLFERTESSKTILTEDNKELLTD